MSRIAMRPDGMEERTQQKHIGPTDLQLLRRALEPESDGEHRLFRNLGESGRRSGHCPSSVYVGVGHVFGTQPSISWKARTVLKTPTVRTEGQRSTTQKPVRIMEMDGMAPKGCPLQNRYSFHFQ